MNHESIRNKKLIFHLTALENMGGIFSHGLQPRAKVKPCLDIADHEILTKRGVAHLENYVPFHFFVKNPFDGAVIKAHSNTIFVYLSVLREEAKNHGFFILPKHPLSDNDEFELFKYEEGFKKINWLLMDKRDYTDKECKNVCMAECLSKSYVPLSLVHSIAVPNERALNKINSLKEKYSNGYNGHINLKPYWFPRV